MPEDQAPPSPEPARQPALQPSPRPPEPGPQVPAPRARVLCACPRCGDVALLPHQVRLVVCASQPERSCYQFPCPRCGALVTRSASERVVLGLSARGAVVDVLPLEVLEHPDGPPLGVDDLLDLLLALQDGDVVDAARGSAPG